MHEWNAETIRKRAADVRASAKVDEDRATLRKQFAVTLEDIAAAWEKGNETDLPVPVRGWMVQLGTGRRLLLRLWKREVD